MEACAHAFFNELRQPGSRMPSGREFPPLYNFTAQGMWCIRALIHIQYIADKKDSYRYHSVLCSIEDMGTV